MVEVLRLAAAVLLLAALVACGKTGELYLPGQGGQDGNVGEIVTRPASSPPPASPDTSNSPRTVDSPQTPPSPAPEVTAPAPDSERDKKKDGGTAEPR